MSKSQTGAKAASGASQAQTETQTATETKAESKEAPLRLVLEVMHASARLVISCCPRVSL
eukprot:scaffold7436_cov258-Pinguiococcus_pyrenoidosus.AAC.2